MNIENYLFIELCDLHEKGLVDGEYSIIHGKDKVLRFKHGNLCPINIKDDSERTVVIVGHPSFNNKIDVGDFISDYIKTTKQGLNDFYSQINGEFLVIDFNKLSDEITIINSRFASPVVFYAIVNKRFVLSTAYTVLFKYLINNRLAKVLPEKAYEVLSFRRLFGTGSYDSHSKYLESASKLSWRAELKIEQYWKPNIYENNLSLIDNANNLVELLDESVKYTTSDNKR